MSGLMRRLTRGRAATDDEATRQERGTSGAVGDAATTAQPGGGAPVPADEQATIVTRRAEGATSVEPAAPTETAAAAEPGERVHDLPAGLDPDELNAVPVGSARRSRLRRRLQYLRHARELLLRDLGGFYYEAHRSEAGADAHRRLLDVKARRLATLDAEVRELEERLSEAHPQAVLREPGIGGTCAECGELHGSDARFCPRCGTPLTRRGGRRREATGAADEPYEEKGRPTTASLWGRPRTSEPAPPRDEATQAAPSADAAADTPTVGAKNAEEGGT
jgi:hypothetical protein